MNELFNFKERWGGEIDRKKRKLLNSFLILTSVAIIFLLVNAANTIKKFNYIGAGVEPTNVISVSGDGEVFAIPDIANISFSSRVTAKSIADAQRQVTEVMNSAIDFAKKSGVEDKDIKTTNYSANPHYEYRTDSCPAGNVYCPGKQILTGYDVAQTISVKVRKTDSTGDVLAGLGKLKVTDIFGPDFTIDDDTAVKAEARKKAIDDAKTKASVLAKDLGVDLVRIVSFSESGNSPIYYAKTMSMGLGGADESAPVPNIPKGENKITSSVMITYEIR